MLHIFIFLALTSSCLSQSAVSNSVDSFLYDSISQRTNGLQSPLAPTSVPTSVPSSVPSSIPSILPTQIPTTPYICQGSDCNYLWNCIWKSSCYIYDHVWCLTGYATVKGQTSISRTVATSRRLNSQIETATSIVNMTSSDQVLCKWYRIMQ